MSIACTKRNIVEIREGFFFVQPIGMVVQLDFWKHIWIHWENKREVNISTCPIDNPAIITCYPKFKYVNFVSCKILIVLVVRWNCTREFVIIYPITRWYVICTTTAASRKYEFKIAPKKRYVMKNSNYRLSNIRSFRPQ